MLRLHGSRYLRRLALPATMGVLCAIVPAAGARAAGSADFPPGSLALGQPSLHSEDQASGGIVDSAVPPASLDATDDLLVTARSDMTIPDRTALGSMPGVTVLGALTDLPVELVRVAAADRGQVMAKLHADGWVADVQPDITESPVAVTCGAPNCLVPNDPQFSDQWYLDNAPGSVPPPGAGGTSFGADVDAPLAWSRGLGSPDVRIAVIDTGIDAGQPDLAGKVVAAANFTDANTTTDRAGHGTHVAGTAAALFNNGVGIAGMAPNARLINAKVMAVDANGKTTGDCGDVAEGIVWATDQGANVLNLSLGSPDPCEAMRLAVDYATSHGALVVAAAGNSSTTTPFYPAAFPGVLSVAATDDQDRLASFSNRGASWVDVAAPGVGIVSTLPTYDNATGDVGYGYLSGTSMASPIVAGIAALLWSQVPPGQTNQEVESRIFATAQPIAGTGTDWRYGAADACRAVTANPAVCVPAPTVGASRRQPHGPAPPNTAQPAPGSLPPGANAAPGAYSGALGRRGGRLRLIVGERGDSLIRLQGTLSVVCSPRGPLTVRVAALSTSDYGRVVRGGRFALRLRVSRGTLRNQQIDLSGRFNLAARRVQATIRVTGATSTSRCDSGALTMKARRAP